MTNIFQTTRFIDPNYSNGASYICADLSAKRLTGAMDPCQPCPSEWLWYVVIATPIMVLQDRNNTPKTNKTHQLHENPSTGANCFTLSGRGHPSRRLQSHGSANAVGQPGGGDTFSTLHVAWIKPIGKWIFVWEGLLLHAGRADSGNYQATRNSSA